MKQNRPLTILQFPAQVAVALFIPPLATLLAWRDILHHRGLAAPVRGWWVLMVLIPGLGPLMYIGIARGRLWGAPRQGR
jgi:hypothetical protein